MSLWNWKNTATPQYFGCTFFPCWLPCWQVYTKAEVIGTWRSRGGHVIHIASRLLTYIIVHADGKTWPDTQKVMIGFGHAYFMRHSCTLHIPKHALRWHVFCLVLVVHNAHTLVNIEKEKKKKWSTQFFMSWWCHRIDHQYLNSIQRQTVECKCFTPSQPVQLY